MTGIEKITNRIKREAEERAEKTTSDAKAEADAIIDQANQKAKRSTYHMLVDAREQAEQLERRTISVGELEARKLRLGAKQDVIDACFVAALDRLCTMEPDTYIDMLASMVYQVLESDGEIKLNVGDRKRIGEQLVDRVNQKAGGSSPHRVTLSKKTIRGRGGFILQCGQVEINCRLETLVESRKEELIPEVASVLFD